MKYVYACFVYYHFNEQLLPRLGRDETPTRRNNELIWNNENLYYLDPYIGQCENDVQHIVHLQMVANQFPNNFTNTARVVNSHVPTHNISFTN